MPPVRLPLCAIVCLAAGAARADTLDDIKARGFFTWGADLEGGGPFVYPDPSDGERVRGFEVELADLLALELTRTLGAPVQARFTQGSWDMLPNLLGTGRIDAVMNGYEWSEERAAVMESTLPYYVYELQLLARQGGAVTAWESLRQGPKKSVGVLGGSMAETYLQEHFSPEQVKVVLYDGNTNAMGEATAGKIDATIQDLPIATFYRREFPALRFVDAPVAPGRYVVYLRKTDARLREALDAALLALRARGELRALYTRWDMWNARQEDAQLLSLPGRPVSLPAGAAATDALGAPPKAAAGEPPGLVAPERAAAASPGFFAKHGALLFQAAGMTVLLSLASFPLAIVLGLLIAVTRLYGPRLLAAPASVYVEVIRGTPLMLQLFVIFFLLPSIGVNISALPAAILGLAINYSAYEAEIYRAGLQAVPTGQMEAALTLGMSRALAVRRIIVPQAVRIVMPPVTNDFIALFKDTSVCSVITVVELSKRYNIAVMNNPGDILPLAGLTALLYLAMSYPLSLLSARMERRLRR